MLKSSTNCFDKAFFAGLLYDKWTYSIITWSFIRGEFRDNKELEHLSPRKVSKACSYNGSSWAKLLPILTKSLAISTLWVICLTNKKLKFFKYLLSVNYFNWNQKAHLIIHVGLLEQKIYKEFLVNSLDYPMNCGVS